MTCPQNTSPELWRMVERAALPVRVRFNGTGVDGREIWAITVRHKNGRTIIHRPTSASQCSVGYFRVVESLSVAELTPGVGEGL